MEFAPSNPRVLHRRLQAAKIDLHMVNKYGPSRFARERPVLFGQEW
jgi:hypothetical protein